MRDVTPLLHINISLDVKIYFFKYYTNRVFVLKFEIFVFSHSKNNL